MTRQAFNDFLNSDGGPSTPRGRGGSRGGRGRGRGRGGAAGAGGGYGGSGLVGKSSFKADYTNMPFDYERINTQGYVKMEGFQVSPHGPSSNRPTTPSSTSRGRGRGSYADRGQGRTSRGGSGQHHSSPFAPATSSGPSGSATPVTGLGYKRDKGKSPIRVESTVGRGIGTGDITWGGRKGAPMFVKAGELFKDGEVDVVTHEEDKAIDVTAVPSTDRLDPHAPQPAMDKTIGEPPSRPTAAAQVGADHSHGESPVPEVEVPATDHTTTILRLPTHDRDPSRPVFESSANLYTTHLFASMVNASSSRYAEAQSESPIRTSPSLQPEIATEDQTEEEDVSFFIDTVPSETAPGQAKSVFGPASTLYTTHLFAPVGSTSSKKPSSAQARSDDEKIIFKPRTFKEPVPITVEVPRVPMSSGSKASGPSAPAAPPTASLREPIQAFIDPRAVSGLSRKAKKAAKRANRKSKQLKSFKKRAGLRDDFGAEDDIDWGSDGPPDDLLRVEGPEGMALDGGKEERDMEILRDYLAGTLLNEKDEEEERQAEEGDATDSLNGCVGDRSEGEDDSLQLVKGKASDKAKRKDKAKAPVRPPRPTTWDVVDDIRIDIPHDEDETDDNDSEGDYEDDSEASSVLGNLQAIMDAMDSQDEDDVEEEGVDEDLRFVGKSALTSEDESEWFIRNMEEALGSPSTAMSSIKNKKGLFHAIENGSFDYDLPTVPAKKGKKKDQHVPEVLHAQWEADRQKKAAKKRQRELDRLFADLQAANASAGRRKQKGSSKAHQASLAHLIPASATEVAEMFDIEAEESAINAMESGSRGGGAMAKMRKMLNLPPLSGYGGAGEMQGIIDDVRAFLADSGRTTFTMEPMEKEGRQRIHMMAECFGLKSTSKGKGKARYTCVTLVKTSRSGVHIDEASLTRIISASDFSGGKFFEAYYSRRTGRAGTSGKVKKGPADRGASTRAREGELVGEGAERIGQGNVGHRLLSKMGWADGDRIGRTGGLDNPIVAIVKNTKSGLGAYSSS